MLKSLTPTASTLLTTWQDARIAAKQATPIIVAERVARAELVAHVFSDAPVGTNNFALPEQWTLKYVRSLDYKLDNTPVDPNDPSGTTRTELMLDKLAALGNDGQFIAERVVKWKPELSVSEYKKLTPEQRAIVDTVLTTSDASPEVTLIPPASAK